MTLVKGEVQQLTGSKKYHYCTFSREIDRQCEGNGINLCSSNAGADFAQHACHAPFCVVTILSSANSVYFMQYTTGVASKVLPKRILESTAVTSVHKVTNHLAEIGTVTNTVTTTAAGPPSSLIQLLSRPRDKTTVYFLRPPAPGKGRTLYIIISSIHI